MVTIKDIANKAGVTPATVSMALNDKPSVSQETKKRIRLVARQMGYYPSSTAKALRTKKSNTLGLIVGSLRNEFFMDLIYAVEEYASSKGYIVFVCDAERSSSKVVSSLRALAARGVDGILISLGFYPDGETEAELRRIMDNGIKLVSFTTAVDYDFIPLVTQAELDSCFDLVEKVCSFGHRKIGIIAAPEGSWLETTRFFPLRKALESKGIYDEALVRHCNTLNTEDGEKAALDLMEKNPDISCIMCINDMVALGAMNAARKLSLCVPDELSITGFDGISSSSLVSPRLTTMKIPRYEMGTAGCRIAIDWIETGTMDYPRVTMIKSQLTEGESLAEAEKKEN